MKVLYALPQFRANTGQETRLAQIIKYGQGKWESTLMSNNFFLSQGSFPLESNVGILKIQYYYSLFLNPFPVRSAINRFDLVHIESGVPYLYAARPLGIPKIYTLHGEFEQTKASITHRIKGALANILELKLAGIADALIGISKWACDFYKDEYGLDLHYIPDSIDMSLFRYKKKTVDRERLKLTMVGGWDGFNGRKRQHDFFDLMPSLVHAFPGIILKMVGLRTEQIETLKAIVREKGLMKSVEFIGKVPDQELASVISDTDILVVTSLWEGFHRPTVEAMASGVPVLARHPATGFNPLNVAHYQHVKESGGGDTFDLSRDDIVEKVEGILDHYCDMAWKGYEYAKQFDNRVILPKYEHLYRKLL
jgi:glycosyltransferase involved in cell wall biosynthesis